MSGRTSEFRPGRAGEWEFLCDGDSTLAQRALRTDGIRGDRAPWQARIAAALLSGAATRTFLQQNGHWFEEGGLDRSLQRVRRNLAWIADPASRACAAPADLDFTDFLASVGAVDPLRVVRQVTVPIVVHESGGDAEILPMDVELVSAHRTSDALVHFPSSEVTFAPLDDLWLDAFDAALTQAQTLVSQSASKPVHAIGAGLGVRWRLQFEALIRRRGQDSREAQSRVSFGGPSASAAFALACASLLAREEGFVPGVRTGGGDTVALCEWRALPLATLLVSADVGRGELVRVGGLERTGGPLPPKLAALEAYRKSRNIHAVGVAFDDAPGVSHADDLPLVRGHTLAELAHGLLERTDALFGEPRAIPLARTPADRLAALHDQVLGEVARRVQRDALGSGTCTIIEAGDDFDLRSFGVRWVRDSMHAGATRIPRLAAWAFAGPTDSAERMLGALEHSLRMNLAAPREQATRSIEWVAEFLGCACEWSRQAQQPAILFLECAGTSPAGIGALLPSRMPPGVHLWLATAPGCIDAAASGWDLLEADDSDASEELGIFRLAQLADNWRSAGTVVSAEIAGPGARRFEFREPQCRVVRFERDWLYNDAAFRDEIGELDPARPCVIAGWPGGENTTKQEEWLGRAARERGVCVLLLCRRPPAAAPRGSTRAYAFGIDDKPQPVELATLPGLDRGPYALLVETAAPHMVLPALAGAEQRVPHGNPRRWWLTLPGALLDAPDLPQAARRSADSLWLRRFASQPIGYVVNEPAIDPGRVADFCVRHRDAAIVVTSMSPQWLRRLGDCLLQASRSAWRAQVSAVADVPVAPDPSRQLADFLALAASVCPGFLREVQASSKLVKFMPRSSGSDEILGDDVEAFDMSGIAYLVESTSAGGASDLLRLVARNTPALLPRFALAAVDIPGLAVTYLDCMAAAPVAFADAMATEALRARLPAEAQPAPRAALALAVACLRERRMGGEFELFLRDAPGGRERECLQAIASRAPLPRTAAAVRFAARCGAAGNASVTSLLSGATPDPHDGVFWSAVWNAPVDSPLLSTVLEHPAWCGAAGLRTCGPALPAAILADARAGFPLPMGVT